MSSAWQGCTTKQLTSSSSSSSRGSRGDAAWRHPPRASITFYKSWNEAALFPDCSTILLHLMAQKPVSKTLGSITAIHTHTHLPHSRLTRHLHDRTPIRFPVSLTIMSETLVRLTMIMGRKLNCQNIINPKVTLNPFLPLPLFHRSSSFQTAFRINHSPLAMDTSLAPPAASLSAKNGGSWWLAIWKKVQPCVRECETRISGRNAAKEPWKGLGGMLWL